MASRIKTAERCSGKGNGLRFQDDDIDLHFPWKGFVLLMDRALCLRRRNATWVSWKGVVLLGFVLCLVGSSQAFGQDRAFRIVDGQRSELWPQLLQITPREDQFNLGGSDTWRSALTTYLQSGGYFSATIDSVNWENRVVFVHRGTQHSIASVQLDVVSPEGEVENGGEATRATRWFPATSLPMPFTSSNTRTLINDVLSAATADGFLGAEASVESIRRNEDGWELTISVRRGQSYSIAGVVLEGDDTTHPTYASRLTGISKSTSAADFDPGRSVRSLKAEGLHGQVGSPRFELTSDSTALVVIPVVPHSAGDFDLVAGYLPASAGRGAQFVGSGHIKLLNAFGRGRLYSAQVDRLPGQSSGVEVAFRDPYIRLLPVSIQGSFQGYQQDSTFSSLGLQVGLGLHLDSRLDQRLEIGVRFSKERTKALQAGLAWVGDEQRIGHTSASFIGVETTFQNVDDASSPRKGSYIFATIETGQKRRTIGRIVEQDSIQVSTRVRQQRVRFEVRNFVTLSTRFTVALGVDARLLLASELDASELLRMGGAQTLRGYDENQFRGKSVGRVFVELKGYANPTTFGLLFFDFGVVEHVKSQGRDAFTSTHPGFGVGFGYSSPIGPISISYAVNNIDPLSEGRIHLGLSIGL